MDTKKVKNWASKNENLKNKLIESVNKYKGAITSYNVEKDNPAILQDFNTGFYYDCIVIGSNKTVRLPSTAYGKKAFCDQIKAFLKGYVAESYSRRQADKHYIINKGEITKITKIELHRGKSVSVSNNKISGTYLFKAWVNTNYTYGNAGGTTVIPESIVIAETTGFNFNYTASINEANEEYQKAFDEFSRDKKTLMGSGDDPLSDTELSDIQLTSVDSCDKFISEVSTPIQKPITASLKDTLNTAIDAATFQGTSKIIDNVIGEINKPATLERKLTKVEVVKRPYSSIQKSLSADDLKKATNKVDERFDKRIHNVNKGSDGDPYSLLTKLDRPGCIKMYPATKDGYANPERIDCFLIQAVQTSLREKFSIFQSLSGDVLAYFFGKQPVIYRFSAALYNTYNQQWWHDFRSHYDKRLRGTAAIKKNIRTVVSYEDHIIEGFFLEMNSNQSTTNPALVNIDFSILLLQETVLGEYSEPADITGYREDADSLEMNASIRSTDNGLDKPLSNAEINRNNVQAMLSIVPTMTTFSLPSGVSSDIYNAALFPTADLEDYLNHLEPGTSGTITMDASTIPMTEDGKPDMEKQVAKKNNTEVKNKDELNNKSIEYKKNEEVIASAKNKADDLANRTNTQYGETLKNGTVTVTNSDAKVRIQPNDNAELSEEAAVLLDADYKYSKTSGMYYYLSDNKGWIKNTDVKDNTDSKSQDSKPFTTGKLQFHNPATVGRNNMVIRSERSSAQEYLIGTVEYRSGTRYTFTDHKGKWFYVINVPLTDGRVKSGWTFENNVTGIAYDN